MPMSLEPAVLLIGTGGTIAGQAASANDHVGYRSAALGVEALVAAVPPLAGMALRTEQLAQLDSKDMDFATWARLVHRLREALRDEQVRGVVVTHGTDTLEETAYLLHRTLRPTKPVVLTAAMRPASALGADGPQNLLDAVLLARAGVAGVMVMLGGQVHAAERLRKVHSYALQAFDSPEGGPLARMENGELRWFGVPTLGGDHSADLPLRDVDWPRVEILLNHAGADGALPPLLKALAAQQGRRLGLVLAGTGNGTVSAPLEAALLALQGEGVPVLRASRCAAGPVLGESTLPGAGVLSPVQARVALLLQLLRPASA